MAAGDRGRRGRGTYGGGGDRSRGTSRRGGRSGEDKGRDRERKERERKEREKKEKEKKEKRETEAEERERYSEGGESSQGTSHATAGGVREYKDQAAADKGEADRRAREKRERSERRKGQREAFRRQSAADRASGGLGGTTEYGRNVTDAEIDRQLAKDDAQRRADDAWRKGDYSGWLSNSISATAQGFANSIGTEINDFVDAPLDYTADVLRNPYLGAALAVAAPPAALGVAAITTADNIADYFQGEATGEGALRQGAKDLAGVIQNQGIATLARFVGDPEGTVGAGLGAGLGMAAGGGILGAAIGGVAPGVVGGVIDSAAKAAEQMTPAERRAAGEAAEQRREERDGGDRDKVSTTGWGGKPVSGGGALTQASGTRSRSMYSPAQGWMVDPMDIYGMENLPSVTPSSSTSLTKSDKIGSKTSKALTLAQAYPWMFDQGILSMGTNPYAVVRT